MPDQDSEEEKDIDTIVFNQVENDRRFSLVIKTKPQQKSYFLLYLFS